MAEEFRIKEIRAEIKKKLDDLFSQLKDAHKVYQEVNKRGYEVGYPEIVDYLQNHPFAKTLPLEDSTEKKKKKPKKKKTLEELIDTPPENVNIGDEKWAETHAKYYLKINRTYQTEDRIVKILKSYENKTLNSLPKYVEEISKETNTTIKTIKCVLQKLNLPFDKPTLNLDEKLEQAINTALEIPSLNLQNAAYFLNVHLVGLKTYLAQKSLKFKQRYCNLSTASKIYQATDSGLEIKEIAEKAGVTQRIAAAILEERTTTEPQIIEVLKKLYPDREISKPYL